MKLERHNMKLKIACCATVVFVLLLAPFAYASHVTGGPDVEVINDNNNVDGSVPNPGFDAKNRQSNETTVAISPANPNIVAAGANDYRMTTVFGDGWSGLYLSDDGGGAWFNTMVPGFPSDTSPDGLVSPLLGLDASGDPVVRFDATGNLYVAGVAFNRDFDQPDRPLDTVAYVARYAYTPGTPGGVSTPNSAANPPNFTYAGTTIVDRGAVGFAVPPNQPWGVAGDFVDKEWMEVDANSPAASQCAGNVYVTYTSFHGAGGNYPIKFSASNDGATFSNPHVISTGGKQSNPRNQGSDIGIAPDGTIYVAYRTFASNADPSAINLVRSADCGKHWSQPVVVGQIVAPQAAGVAFRTPTFAFVAVDDTDPQIVYVAYQNYVGPDYNIYVQRSTDGGLTWDAPTQVNDDGSGRHQIFPTIEMSHGALHIAWYDFRHSATPSNEALDVYYACTNCAGAGYPAFSHNERITDVSHNGNCLIFGGGATAFHGDYIELDARWDGAQHVVQIAWADNRDISPCDLDPAPGPNANNTGNRNQNIYADRLLVSP